MKKIFLAIFCCLLLFGCVTTPDQEKESEETETQLEDTTVIQEPEINEENQEALRAAIYQMNKNLQEHQESERDKFFEDHPNATEEGDQLVFTVDAKDLQK